jgi:short-subunit dehydrogenase
MVKFLHRQRTHINKEISIVGQLTAEDSIVYAAAKQFAQNVNAGAVQTSTDESVI